MMEEKFQVASCVNAVLCVWISLICCSEEHAWFGLVTKPLLDQFRNGMVKQIISDLENCISHWYFSDRVASTPWKYGEFLY